jgi:hypothetical protein
MGKSWLALQIACAVGSGGSVLDRSVEQGPVLYMALEDSPRRLQERLRKQEAPPAELTFALEWKPLGAGGLEALRAAMDKRHYKLVVVDTLNRALGLYRERGKHDATLRAVGRDVDLAAALPRPAPMASCDLFRLMLQFHSSVPAWAPAAGCFATPTEHGGVRHVTEGVLGGFFGRRSRGRRSRYQPDH